MTTITTQNSVYEVDEEYKQIRRVSGKNEPTAHFSPDGEWKPYLGIMEWYEGNKVVYWPDGTATTLSRVVSEV